ncbi:Hypothetical protein CINCED_3A025237, partial [Cinara cedri]
MEIKNDIRTQVDNEKLIKQTETIEEKDDKQENNKNFKEEKETKENITINIEKNDRIKTDTLYKNDSKEKTIHKAVIELEKQTKVEFEKIKGNKESLRKLTNVIRFPDDTQLQIDKKEKIIDNITKINENKITKIRSIDKDIIRGKPTIFESYEQKGNPLTKESKIHELSQGYKGEGDEIIKHKIPTDNSLDDVTKSPSTDTIKAEIVDKKDVKTPTELG